MNYLLKFDKPCDQSIPPLQYTQNKHIYLYIRILVQQLLKCLIYICQKTGNIYQMDKQIVVYLYNGTYIAIKMKKITATHNNVNKFYKYSFE